MEAELPFQMQSSMEKDGGVGGSEAVLMPSAVASGDGAPLDSANRPKPTKAEVALLQLLPTPLANGTFSKKGDSDSEDD